MADTINQPGVRCFIPSALDRGWCESEAGFTDACLITRYWQVFFSQSQPDFRWQWLENPGVIVSSKANLATPTFWRYFKTITPIELNVVVQLLPIVPPSGPPQIHMLIDIHYSSTIVGPILHELYTNIFTTTKRGIHNVGACQRIFPPSTPCSSLGPIRLRQWASCEGEPVSGPDYVPDP